MTTSVHNPAPASEAVLSQMFNHLANWLRLVKGEAWRDALIHIAAYGNRPASDFCGDGGDYWQDNELHYHLGGHERNSTHEFCQAHGLNEDAVLSWLAANYSDDPDRPSRVNCDCEALKLVSRFLFDLTLPDPARWAQP